MNFNVETGADVRRMEGKTLTGQPVRSVIRRVTLVAALAAALFVCARPAAAERELTFAICPWADAESMRKLSKPLIDYISERTGLKIHIVVPPTYDALIEDFMAGDIDIAAVNSVMFLKIHRRMPRVRYMATMLRDYGGEKRDSYIGYIITRKKAPYGSFEDLQGKIFGFVDIDSASGYKVPRAMMGLKGYSPDTFFKKYFFVGSHDELALAVKNGSVEAGATWDNSYDINTKKFGKVFKIIEKTPPIPNDAWIAGARAPDEAVEMVKSVLLELTPADKTNDGRLALDADIGQPAVGWVETGIELYTRASDLLLYEAGD